MTTAIRPTRRRLGLLTALLVPALALSACGGSDDSADDGGGGGDSTVTLATTPTTEEALEPEDGGTLRFAVEADSDGYHPIGNRWSISGNYVGSAIYEPLMVENGDGTLTPWLAESVTPNDDATEWTIVTKEGITFHDGTPFDAEAVAANVQARLESPLTQIANRPVESTEVIDERTVVVKMSEPWAAYDHVLAAVGGYMAAPAMLGPDGDPTAVIGTGPFVFEEWVPNDHFTVSRNEDYWGEPAHLDGIEFTFLPDLQTRRAALEAGDIDGMHTPDPATIRDFRDTEGIVSYESSSEPFHVLLNSAVPPFDNALARQAVAYATIPEAVIAAADGDGVLQPASSPFVPTNPWHLEDNGYPAPDPEAAADFAEQYEEEVGEPISFTLKGSEGLQDVVGAALIEQWSNAGIEATFEKVDSASLINQVVVGDFQAVQWRNHNWVDPDFNYIFWHSSTDAPNGDLSINFTHTVTPELDAALEQGRASLDEAERREAYDEVQRILNEELTHLWLFDQVWAIATTDTVHGFQNAAETDTISRLEPKTMWGEVWMEQ